MKIRFGHFLILLSASVVLFSSGCLMKRTVTKDGSVVAEGYVIKQPLMRGNEAY
jgi:hypothetical protein